MVPSRLIALRDRAGAIRAYTVIDRADAEWISRWRWCLNSTGYAVRGPASGSGLILMHREIAGLKPGDGLQVDHINRNRLDNRRANLRVVTRAEQQQNLPSCKESTSRFRGVSWDRSRNRWRATCQVGYHKKALGRFKTEEEAAAVVASYRAEHMPFSEEAAGSWTQKV